MVRVSRRIQDKRVLRLIGKYLRAGVMVKGRLQATPAGVPQGGPLFRNSSGGYASLPEGAGLFPWRYARTKVRNLLKLGTSKRQAIMTAISRRGPWHLARTLATQSGMTNKWLSEQGLISVKEQWVRIHYPATAR